MNNEYYSCAIMASFGDQRFATSLAEALPDRISVHTPSQFPGQKWEQFVAVAGTADRFVPLISCECRDFDPMLKLIEHFRLLERDLLNNTLVIPVGPLVTFNIKGTPFEFLQDRVWITFTKTEKMAADLAQALRRPRATEL